LLSEKTKAAWINKPKFKESALKSLAVGRKINPMHRAGAAAKLSAINKKRYQENPSSVLNAVRTSLLRYHVNGSFILGLKEILAPAGFEAEYIIGNRVADFANPKEKIVVECDGPTHNTPGIKRRDQIRDAYLKGLGWRVIHVKETR
jgi:very-short-patch-repair endonuclease